MDLNKKVTVLTPNGRRQNIKITSSTTLLQILEETCQKHGFSSDEYGLKNHNKELDLSQMFKFSGLANNCMLEMFECTKKRIESLADICVQLEDGTRYHGEFRPICNLWDVLVQLCPDYTKDDMSPVFLYMRKEIFGTQLRETSLKSLGITGGRTMLRVVNKKPEEIRTQAGVYVPPTVKEVPKDDQKDEARPAKAKGNTGFSITADLVQSLKNKDKPAPVPSQSSSLMSSDPALGNVDKKPQYDWGTGTGRTISSKTVVNIGDEQDADEMEIEPEVNVIGERNAVIFSLDSAQREAEELPDSFYDLTVNDLKLVLRDLKKISDGSEDSPLLTAKLRELEEHKSLLRKLAQYKNCVIRVQFPNRLVLQGIFRPTEKVEDVMNFVRSFLINPNQEFYLFTIPPKVQLVPGETLLESKCVPTAILHLGLNDDEGEMPLVKEEFMQKLTPPEGALFVASRSRLSRPVEEEQDGGSNMEVPVPGTSANAVNKRPRGDDFRQSTAENPNVDNVPQWFQTVRK